MKKVFVSGGAGFVGSTLVPMLVQEGWTVTVADNLSNPSRQYSVPEEQAKAARLGYQFLPLDLTQGEETREALRGFDACIHLAGRVGGVRYMEQFRATILDENSRLHSSVFRAAVANRLERIVYVSTSMVYERGRVFPHRESEVNEVFTPLLEYSFSKLLGEFYCRAFAAEHGLKYVIIRPYNPYGLNEKPGRRPGDSHVIPDLIGKLLQGQDPLEILGDGQATRCFTHVQDLSRAIILAATRPEALNEDFNIGSGQEVTILELAKTLHHICYPQGEFRVKFLPGFKQAVQRSVPDISKARRLLGWQPETALADGLREVVEWMSRGTQLGSRA
jgi:nucleoside-diphosphate-sugar epimerase